MLSLITAPNCFLLPPRLIGGLNFHSISLPLVVVVGRRSFRRQQRPPPVVSFNSDSRSLGFGVLKRKHYEGCWFCSCKSLESEGDMALEAEILEFMTKSEKPEVFPTKEELIDAGRMDLVEAIARNGGWLSLGWDLDDGNEKVKVEENRFARNCEDERAKVQESVGVDRDCDNEAVEVGRFRVSSVSIHKATQWPSSSGRSLELGDGEEIGIEGILGRLEKQRNLSFGVDWGKNGHSAPVLSEYAEESDVGTPRVADSTGLGRSSGLASGIPNNGMINNSGGKFSPKESVSDFDGSKDSLKPEMWRTWSLQRTGFSGAEFEAGEVYLDVDKMHEAKDASKEEILARAEDSTEPLDIRTRLQHLELELASALCLLRSKSQESVSNEGHEFSSNDLRKLSDAWEFQENEIMNAQDRLRSMRAKLAVLEGKMALVIIDAQNVIEGKQKRIDGARRALQLLRTTCVVWHNSASEVLLAGSYDGWTTQGKMEKSKTGIFSICLKLYPGRYEIKFIVDGVWKTDPLRPIINNNGYDNNLLIIT